MFMYRASFLVAVAILMTGCPPGIVIVKPDRNNPYDPVTHAVVKYDPKFNSGGVELDGAALGGFSPAPAAGGTSSTPLVITTTGGHQIESFSSCGGVCLLANDKVAFTPPALIYNSTSYTRVDKNLKQFQPATVFVGVQNFRSVPINVTIVETSSPKRVKLAPPGGTFQQPGSPITVTIPAASTKADFQIQGDVLGVYVLGFTAPGVVSGPGSGSVMP
jgi:hypothetical protein